jgi:DNA-binding response OmpR family regulator
MSTNKKILCIEDDAEIIDLMRVILNNKGFDVLGAVNGTEGLKVIESEHPDLILLDLMMPGIDGWEVYQQMKANEAMRDIHVIIVTAKAHNVDKVLALRVAGVADFIAKPFSPADLLASIEKVFAKPA